MALANERNVLPFAVGDSGGIESIVRGQQGMRRTVTTDRVCCQELQTQEVAPYLLFAWGDDARGHAVVARGGGGGARARGGWAPVTAWSRQKQHTESQHQST
jgi:hypothetical protein